MSLHRWVFAQKAFRELLGFGEGGETGHDNRWLESVFGRTRANIMGKKMLTRASEAGLEEPPFHCPGVVLTHEVREPWVRKGGTTFYFVNDGIEGALGRAREAAGARTSAFRGADVVRQYLTSLLTSASWSRRRFGQRADPDPSTESTPTGSDLRLSRPSTPRR